MQSCHRNTVEAAELMTIGKQPVLSNLLMCPWSNVENAVSNGLTGVACTDEQRLWNIGTQRKLAPKLFADIVFFHHKATDAFHTPEVRLNHLPLSPTPIFQNQDELREGLKHLNLCVSGLLYKCVNAAKELSQESAAVPHTDHDGTDICGRCMSFSETFVAIAPDKCQILEQITLEQSASHLWHGSRKVRITASSAKKVPIRGNPQYFLKEHIYPKFHGNAATQHGVESEALALRRLEGCGYKVTRRGTVLCTHEPSLSANLDGVLDTGKLLEIKCPLLKSNESLRDLIGSQRYDLKKVDGKTQLQQNGPHGFYMQVQLCMFCTGLRA
ncbi:hypothetical protein AOLI_G00227940 [Acnodon oligacanthus]